MSCQWSLCSTVHTLSRMPLSTPACDARSYLTLGVRHDGNGIKRFVGIDRPISWFGILEGGEDSCETFLACADTLIMLRDNLAKSVFPNDFQSLVFEELVSSVNECASTGISEEFSLQIGSGDDCNRGGARKDIQEFFEFPQLELCTIFDPRFLHELVIFLLIDCDKSILKESETIHTLLRFITSNFSPVTPWYRPPFSLMNTIFMGSSSLASSPAATSALMLRIWPSLLSARLHKIGKALVQIEASMSCLLTRVILPTKLYLVGSRVVAVKTPEVMGQACMPSFSSAVTSFKNSSRKMRQVICSVLASMRCAQGQYMATLDRASERGMYQ